MPLKSYEQKLLDGVLRDDSVQRKSVKALQRLHCGLVHQCEVEGNRSFLAKMMGKKRTFVRGVYMYGGVGRGKSMLMDLFFHTLPADIAARRVHFHEFMIEVHNYLHERRSAGSASEGVDGSLPLFAARLSEQVSVLCFDEFHVVDVADAMILGRLFTALFERGVSVVTTSNWAPDDLYKDGLQRDRFLPFIELMKQQLEVVHLDNPTDYRKARVADGDVYYSPICERVREDLDKLFIDMSGGLVGKPQQLVVKGHVIDVACEAGELARFEFSSLCERALGAEDYLTVAQKYRTVFLQNIPRLNYDRRNEAKRLMILIDALYENHVRVIFSAEAMPDKLYLGHDHAFEFERTISRIHEMQSSEYLDFDT